MLAHFWVTLIYFSSAARCFAPILKLIFIRLSGLIMKIKFIALSVALAASVSSQAAVLDLDLDLLSNNVTQLNTQVDALNGQVTGIINAAPTYIGQLAVVSLDRKSTRLN